MEENKIGQFIRDRRLALCLTQQQLADRLGVTDKAVSKWERSVSYPDITILRELAAALEVSVTELLAGERDAQLPAVPPEVQDVVVDTVAYAETARERNQRWKLWIFIALTAGCLIAALVLVIVGLARGSLWAAMLAIRCIAFGWAVCYPLLRTERPVRNALIIASVFVYPLLWSLGAQRAWHLGITVVSIAYTWAAYWAVRRHWERKEIAVTLIMLLGVLLHVSINAMVGRHLETAVLVTGGTLFLDLVCLAGAYAFAARQMRE
ncbi:MAG: helix-turn-helix domain-containing protein [Oscillospiraceae bacterium]|nr:helix-turn-helix domain-containing protein [Oscillospiraceae bacterium]